jgi:hypothetical protein
MMFGLCVKFKGAGQKTAADARPRSAITSYYACFFALPESMSRISGKGLHVIADPWVKLSKRLPY